MIYICSHIKPAYELNYEHTVIDNTKSPLSEDYGHMRGVYYIWKNLELPEEIGIFQQRRYLEINSIPDDYDCVCSLHKGLPHVSIREQYIHTPHNVLYLDILENIIGNDFAYYVRNYPIDYAYMDDMFIFKKNDFISYCEFIFRILKEKDNKVGSIENKYLSERITSYWIWKNFKKEKIFLANKFIIEK